MPNPLLSRRQFVSGLAVAGTSLALSPGVRAGSGKKTPKAVIQETRVISWESDKYHGWPTIARRADGELLLAYSGREEHACPFGRLELMRSKDGGRTWSWPQVIYDSPVDDRDGGIIETAKGSLLITTVTNNQWEKKLNEASRGEDEARFSRWRAAQDRVPASQRKGELGSFLLRSTDGGVTWSPRQRLVLHSPHGPTQLRDGRLLYPGIARWLPEKKMGVCESTDDGVTWTWLSDIPHRPGDRLIESEGHYNYIELSAVECDDGKIVCQLRNRNKANEGETLQTESSDGGRSWNTPHPIGVWGVPSHLLHLNDGRILMTYGHRRKPFGNQARVSADNGATWSEPMILSGDGAGFDLGYPSTVQLEDGTLVTVWYEKFADNPRAQLRQAWWKLA
ncbi:MAG: sialidase family protein [Pirellulales bacterium]